MATEGLPEGPTEGVSPLWYDPLRDMDCSDENLLGSGTLPIPRAGTILCEAAATGDASLWEQGERALDEASPQNCWEVAAAEALGRLVEAHRGHPEAEITMDQQPGVACPVELEALASPQVPGIVSAQLPVSRCGGAPIFLEGSVEKLEENDVRAVTLRDREVAVHRGNGGFFFRAPAWEAPEPVTVTVSDADVPVAGEVFVLFEEPAAPCPTLPPPPEAEGT